MSSHRRIALSQMAKPSVLSTPSSAVFTNSRVRNTGLKPPDVSPQPSLDKSKSLAELFGSRKLRTTLFLLSTTVRHKPSKSRRMEQQFNRRHGARSRAFRRGDPVLVCTYQGPIVSWVKGKVLERVGRVLYKVLIGKGTRIRQANQPRQCFADSDQNQSDDLRTLFELFDLQQPPDHEQARPVECIKPTKNNRDVRGECAENGIEHVYDASASNRKEGRTMMPTFNPSRPLALQKGRC